RENRGETKKPRQVPTRLANNSNDRAIYGALIGRTPGRGLSGRGVRRLGVWATALGWNFLTTRNFFRSLAPHSRQAKNQARSESSSVHMMTGSHLLLTMNQVERSLTKTNAGTLFSQRSILLSSSTNV